MITNKHTLIFTFAVCSLALAALGAQQKPVERPFKIDGHITMTVNLSTGNALMMDWGEATHAGRYDNQGTGHMDPTTGSISGSGTFTAANGEKIFWVQQQPYQVEYTGGTGRFENVAGGFRYAPTSDVVTTFPDTNTMIMTFTYKGVGTITH